MLLVTDITQHLRHTFSGLWKIFQSFYDNLSRIAPSLFPPRQIVQPPQPQAPVAFQSKQQEIIEKVARSTERQAIAAGKSTQEARAAREAVHQRAQAHPRSFFQGAVYRQLVRRGAPAGAATMRRSRRIARVLAGPPIPSTTPAPVTPMAPAAPQPLAGAGYAGATSLAAVGAIGATVVAALAVWRENLYLAIGQVKGFAAAMATTTTDAAAAIHAFGAEMRASGSFFAGIIGRAATETARWMHVLDAASLRYARFSPQVAYAEALSRVQMTLGDFRRAQQLGPTLSRYVATRTELQQRIEDAKMRFIIKIGPVIIAMMERIEGILPELEAMVTRLLELGGGVLGGIFAGIKEDVERIRREIEDAKRPKFSLNPLNEILQIFSQEGTSDVP
jgi:hypothetical protein